MPDLTRDEAKELYRRGFEDPVWWCRTFLHHWFPTPMPWLHRGMIAILTRRAGFLPAYGELDKIRNNFVFHEVPGDTDSNLRSVFSFAEAVPAMTLGRFTLIMIPRGLSKTTIRNAITLWEIVYEQKHFPVIVSETAGHAEMQLNTVRGELEGNAKLKAVYGDLVPQRNDNKKWTGNLLQTRNGITIASRGRGAQIEA